MNKVINMSLQYESLFDNPYSKILRLELSSILRYQNWNILS